MHLQIIVGSVREGRASLPVAEWARDEATSREDFTVELVDLKAWNLPMFEIGKPPILGNGRFLADKQDTERLHSVLDELAWWAAALKNAGSAGSPAGVPVVKRTSQNVSRSRAHATASR
jgi:hypothetical protein